MATLGARLRHLRRERDCTLQEVSDGSGLTPSFLSRLERGIVNISVGNLRKSCLVLWCADHLFLYRGVGPPRYCRPGRRSPYRR